MIVAPVRSYSNWNQRPSDQMEQVEPYQKFFFICEGANTEVFYFKKLIDLRKKLGIHPLIDICLLEKIEEDRTVSYPLQLYTFAQKQKKNPDINFDPTRDKMVIVFDADIFEKDPLIMRRFLKRLEKPRIYSLLQIHPLNYSYFSIMTALLKAIFFRMQPLFSKMPRWATRRSLIIFCLKEVV